MWEIWPTCAQKMIYGSYLSSMVSIPSVAFAIDYINFESCDNCFNVLGTLRWAPYADFYFLFFYFCMEKNAFIWKVPFYPSRDFVLVDFWYESNYLHHTFFLKKKKKSQELCQKFICQSTRKQNNQKASLSSDMCLQRMLFMLFPNLTLKYLW